MLFRRRRRRRRLLCSVYNSISLIPRHRFEQYELVFSPTLYTFVYIYY